MVNILLWHVLILGCFLGYNRDHRIVHYCYCQYHVLWYPSIPSLLPNLHSYLAVQTIALFDLFAAIIGIVGLMIVYHGSGHVLYIANKVKGRLTSAQNKPDNTCMCLPQNAPSLHRS
jgi:hypothetical protein